MPFHKSCYTSRSSGYKYRTLSTNTGPGDKKSKRSSIGSASVQQDVLSALDLKFINLRKDISCLISKELEDTVRSRQYIHDKLETIENKVNAMVELRDNVLAMRESLNAAESTLGELYEKVQRVEVMNELNSVRNRRSQPPHRALTEEEAEREIYSAVILAPPAVWN